LKKCPYIPEEAEEGDESGENQSSSDIGGDELPGKKLEERILYI
jgi:hypothetical protein